MNANDKDLPLCNWDRDRKPLSPLYCRHWTRIPHVPNADKSYCHILPTGRKRTLLRTTAIMEDEEKEGRRRREFSQHRSFHSKCRQTSWQEEISPVIIGEKTLINKVPLFRRSCQGPSRDIFEHRRDNTFPANFVFNTRKQKLSGSSPTTDIMDTRQSPILAMKPFYFCLILFEPFPEHIYLQVDVCSCNVLLEEGEIITYLIIIDFTSIAKRNIIRLLVAPVIPYMPPTSPAVIGTVSLKRLFLKCG